MLLHSNTMIYLVIPYIHAGNEYLILGVTTYFLFLFFQKSIPIINRAQLIDDAFNLARYCTEIPIFFFNLMLIRMFNKIPLFYCHASQKGKDHPNSASAGDHRVPEQRESLHTLEISNEQPGILWPYVWPKWGLWCFAGKQHKGNAILNINVPSHLLSFVCLVFSRSICRIKSNLSMSTTKTWPLTGQMCPQDTWTSK